MKKRLRLSFGMVFGGAALLLLTTGVVSIGTLLPPVLAILVGVMLLGRALVAGGQERHVFTGTILLLSGCFWLLWEAALPNAEITAIWPVFMSFGGIALIAYGRRRGGGRSSSLTIPGAAIILLSAVFLLFSLGIVERSLAQVTVEWWPAAVIILGVFVYLAGRSNGDGLSDGTTEQLEPDEDRP